jgi:DNA-directed RNA polymerase specialized sigma24 family protein
MCDRLFSVGLILTSQALPVSIGFMANGLSPFPTTQWTAVVTAMKTENTGRRSDAFAVLCRDYWKPLYIFSRRVGHAEHEAEDLTQGFFVYLSQRPVVELATPELGKLRTFLLKVFQRYMGDVRDHGNAKKRGGGVPICSLGMDGGDELPPLDIAGTETPETLYDQAWAHSLLGATLKHLGALEEAEGRGRLFPVLKNQLNGDGNQEECLADTAAQLGISGESVRQALCRLRRKFRDCLRERIAATLHAPDDAQIDEELRALRAALLR